MPIPKPRGGESQDTFMSRCMSWMADNDAGRPMAQRTAICMRTYRDNSKADLPQDSGRNALRFLEEDE